MRVRLIFSSLSKMYTTLLSIQVAFICTLTTYYVIPVLFLNKRGRCVDWNNIVQKISAKRKKNIHTTLANIKLIYNPYRIGSSPRIIARESSFGLYSNIHIHCIHIASLNIKLLFWRGVSLYGFRNRRMSTVKM